ESLQSLSDSRGPSRPMRFDKGRGQVVRPRVHRVVRDVEAGQSADRVALEVDAPIAGSRLSSDLRDPSIQPALSSIGSQEPSVSPAGQRLNRRPWKPYLTPGRHVKCSQTA